MRRLSIALAIVLGVSLAAAPTAAAQDGLAENLTAILDTTFSTLSTTTTNTVTGAVTKTTSDSAYPRLTLNTDALVLPALRLSAGGVFDVDFSSTTIAGNTFDSTTSRMRPYIELRSTNPVFAPAFGYHRREARARVSGSEGLTLVNEDYAGYLGWKPEGLPITNIQVIRTNTFDGDRRFEDATKDFASLISRYTAKTLNVYYQGTLIDSTDRARSLETSQVSHAARVDHSQAFWNRRMLWNGTYNVNRQDLTTKAEGETGEAELPVVAFAGLSALSDTPHTGALQENPALVDSTFSASAGLNLGLPPAGGNARARNLGLDFVNPTVIDRLYVWIDRELPLEIANTFTWEIYSSRDNITWSRESSVSAASFGPFENRFKLDFRAVTARYLKVVTRPLSGTVPDSTRYPDIFVTELQSFQVQSASDAGDTLTRTSQTINADLRFKLIEGPDVYYEGSYWYTGLTSGGPVRDTLSNGFSFNHRFNRLLTAYGRAAREQGRQTEGYREATVTNATLTFTPLPTLTSSVLFTGQDEEIGGRPNDRQSLYIQTNAQMYRGFDLLFGVGWNRMNRETGERLRDRLLSVSASVTPRPNLIFTVNYADIGTQRSGIFVGLPDLHTRTGYFTMSFDPLRTLHLVIGEELIAVTGEQTRTTTSLGANWSPFPDGTLQFIVSYNEALRPVAFGSERNFRPGVRWTFRRQSYVDVTYQRINSELGFERIDSKIFSVDLKLFF